MMMMMMTKVTTSYWKVEWEILRKMTRTNSTPRSRLYTTCQQTTLWLWGLRANVIHRRWMPSSRSVVDRGIEVVR
jgi:hypothetical protein